MAGLFRVVMLLGALFFLMLSGSHSMAQEQENDLGEIFEGFDEFDADSGEPPSPPAPGPADGSARAPDWIGRHVDIVGSTSLGLSYNLNPHRSSIGPPPQQLLGTYYGNLQRLRLRADLQGDLDLPGSWELRAQFYAFYDFAYPIHGQAQYTQQVLDDYLLESEILDLWLAGSPTDWLDVKLGRQVVDWGRSQSLRVLDIWNPLNNREPGLVDIEDLRLPVTMARADAFFGHWTLSALIVPEVRYDYDPPPGSDFFPVPRLDEIPDPPPGGPTKQQILSNLSFLEDQIFAQDPLNARADQWGATPEYGASVTGIFPSWDISIYLARIYQNRTTSVVNLPDLSGLSIVKQEDRVTLIGAGGNYTKGTWLFKAEFAFFDELDYSFLQPKGNDLDPATDLPYGAGHGRFSRIDWMLGAEYYGFKDATVIFEIAHRHLLDYDPLLAYLPNFVYRDSVEAAIRISREFMHARLMAHGTGVVIVNEAGLQGAFMRLWVQYEIRAALMVDLGYLEYFGSDQTPFDSWQHNDRLFAKLRFSFD